MAKNTTKWLIAGGLLLAGGIFWWVSDQERKQREEYARLLQAFKQRYGNNYVPQQGTPEWQQWAEYAIGTYGFVESLWQPGGIFYNKGVPDITQVDFWKKLFSKKIA